MCRKLADFFGLNTHGSINKTPVNQSSNHHLTPWFLLPHDHHCPHENMPINCWPHPLGFGPGFRLPFPPLAARGRDRSNNGSKRKRKPKRNKLSKCSKHKPKVRKLSGGWSLLLVGYFKVGELEIRENFLTFLLEAVWSYSDTTSGVYPKTAPDPRGTHCANCWKWKRLPRLYAFTVTDDFPRSDGLINQSSCTWGVFIARLDLWEAQPLFLLFKMLGWRSDVAG